MQKTYNEQMQHIWQMYEDAGMPTPATKHDVAAWAVRNGYWKPHPTTVVSQCAEDLGKALRAEYRIDEKGRKYRSKHAVRIDSDGVQLTLWADIDKAPRSHMEKSLAQRRQKLVGMGFQLKTDTDVTNAKFPDRQAIQMVLDLRDDIRGCTKRGV